eukprot:COSAG02_NODE_55594_length_289_cov_1.357895_1_plen_46_part_10
MFTSTSGTVVYSVHIFTSYKYARTVRSTKLSVLILVMTKWHQACTI